MRGKVIVVQPRISAGGITPAYAGKRQNHIVGFHLQKDHPRLCGEKPVVQYKKAEILGSPPPMRGKVSIFSPPNYNTRITPAYAGKSFSAEYAPHSCRDHPRLCGEKIQEEADRQGITGSPPPMRGKVNQKQLSIDANGITPAYAGKRPLMQ